MSYPIFNVRLRVMKHHTNTSTPLICRQMFGLVVVIENNRPRCMVSCAQQTQWQTSSVRRLGRHGSGEARMHFIFFFAAQIYEIKAKRYLYIIIFESTSLICKILGWMRSFSVFGFVSTELLVNNEWIWIYFAIIFSLFIRWYS